MLKFTLAVSVLLSGSLSGAPAVAAQPDDVARQDQVQMYSLIVQRLLGPDDTYSEPMPKGRVYVYAGLDAPPPPEVMRQIESFDEREHTPNPATLAGPPPPPPEPFAEWPKGTEPVKLSIPKEMQAEIVSAAKLPQYEFQWLTNPDKQLKLDPRSHALPGGRPMLTLTQFVHLSPDRIYTSGGIYVASTVAGICWYIFKRDSSGWHFEKRIWGFVS